MALTGTIGAIRETVSGVGPIILQARPSIIFRKGAIGVARIGSNLCEIPLSASPRTDLVALGVVRATNAYTSDATTDSGGGAIDANSNPEDITFDNGVKGWFSTAASGANKVTDQMRGQVGYVYDDDTIYATDNNGTLSAKVFIDSVRGDGRVAVRFDYPRLGPTGAVLPSSEVDTARVVMTSLSASYTGSGTGTLTGPANTAFPTQDGVTLGGSGLVVGDTVFMPEGIANIAADTDAGPWEILAPGSGSTAWVLQRPAWYKTGNAIGLGRTIQIGGEGTLWAGTRWRSDAAKGKIIDTDAPAHWPVKVSKGVTNSGGTVTVTGLPVKSAVNSSVIVSPSPGHAPHASTVDWRASAVTAGKVGTGNSDTQASITVVAESAPGTTNTSDVGTYVLTVEN